MRKVLSVVIITVFAACGAYGQKAPPGTQTCDGLAKLTPWIVGDPSFYKMLAAFCRVVVEATPSADSSIKIE